MRKRRGLAGVVLIAGLLVGSQALSSMAFAASRGHTSPAAATKTAKATAPVKAVAGSSVAHVRIVNLGGCTFAVRVSGIKPNSVVHYRVRDKQTGNVVLDGRFRVDSTGSGTSPSFTLTTGRYSVTVSGTDKNGNCLCEVCEVSANCGGTTTTTSPTTTTTTTSSSSTTTSSSSTTTTLGGTTTSVGGSSSSVLGSSSSVVGSSSSVLGSSSSVLGSSSSVLGSSSSATGTLPFTGSADAVPLLLTGIGLVLLGSASLLATRRREQA